MKQTTASNLALLLAPAGWVLCFIGVASQMGDPNPDIPVATLKAERLTQMLLFYLGVLIVFSALWASGYSFSAAKRRAVIAALMCVAPVIALAVGDFIF
ncbi:hypothetical protein SAMN05216570_3845 [Dyella sp. OK004]|uniref:hypothetical protein n=1 Tax=Dyella sp. OK004 TaxID=1855292 RepID=UPI0008F123FA|nr:hypothetical protein [Dyella sp. OK004]SFS18897.1 hypothetical protein SAMN05216570_3845 [Dyella sp. OK004]